MIEDNYKLCQKCLRLFHFKEMAIYTFIVDDVKKKIYLCENCGNVNEFEAPSPNWFNNL